MRISFRRTFGLLSRHLALGSTPEAGAQDCVPGSSGLGDAYYPLYGNGGYDVTHYDLDVAYDPATDQLDGDAAIRATATENLCSFDLDFVGLNVRRVEVDGKQARWSRTGQSSSSSRSARSSRGDASRWKSATPACRSSSSCRVLQSGPAS